MVWRGREPDPTTDPAAPDVLAAYQAAGDERVAAAACYLAAVEAWRRVHPDQSAAYAGKQAVAVILAAKAKFLLRAE
jgi:hypothetical protein